MPLRLIVAVAIVMETFTILDEIFRNTEFHANANYHTFQELVFHTDRMTTWINEYSNHVLNLNDSIHSLSLCESIARYNNIILLHNEIELFFDQLQSVISLLEQDEDWMYFNRELPINYYSNIDNMGENIRLTGNTLIEALRSLEDAIREADPAFTFLHSLWFE